MRKMRFCFVVVFIICMAWQTVHAKGKDAFPEWFHEGVALENQSSYEEAIDRCTNAMGLDKNDVDAYLQRGQAYRATRTINPWIAMADFNKAIAIDPTNAEAYYQRGLLNAFILSNQDANADMTTAARLGHEGAKQWLIRHPQRAETAPLEEISEAAESEGEATTTKEKVADLREYLPSKNEPMIHFDFDKSFIKKEFYPILDGVAGVLNDRLPHSKILVAGHTDNTGKEIYNINLSLSRAEAVKSYLESQHGISPGRIIMEGYGPNNPVDSNKTEAGRAKNRCAHIQFAE
ncbi:MAG: OmpA family protein [Deltaproteobacteria bacterium]|nr:OmpA family protein [Deltaproteobacteria bacterium]